MDEAANGLPDCIAARAGHFDKLMLAGDPLPNFQLPEVIWDRSCSAIWTDRGTLRAVGAIRKSGMSQM
ncbi:hypothetical protein GCM10020255_031140 [Rhodococcus baikonurensis]